jgi:hypothetical protein
LRKLRKGAAVEMGVVSTRQGPFYGSFCRQVTHFLPSILGCATLRSSAQSEDGQERRA